VFPLKDPARAARAIQLPGLGWPTRARPWSSAAASPRGCWRSRPQSRPVSRRALRVW